MKTVEEKYGVPTFETCKKLAKYWKEDTTFCFLSCNKTKSAKLHFNKENLHGGSYYESVNGTFVHTDFTTIYAPQIHELFAALPNELVVDRFVYRLSIYKCDDYVNLSYIDIDSWGNEYDESDITDFIDTFVIEGFTDNGKNIAECLAQIYLTLKEKELL